MKVIENQRPRRDGMIEARGTWGEVTIGTKLALTDSRTEIWEVMGAKTPDQWAYAYTPWYRVVEVGSGEVRSVRPKLANAGVKILLDSPTATLPPRTSVDDAEATMALLTERLGASEVYTQDRATGEIWCPWEPHAGEDGMFVHMRLAHDMDTAAMEAIDDTDARISNMIRVHGQAHTLRSGVGKGGFPHRHVPEDHSLI